MEQVVEQVVEPVYERSKLTENYLRDKVKQFELNFRKDYLKNNKQELKGNVMVYITIGVIEEKGFPESEDVYRLIKLGNRNCNTDAEALEIYRLWEQVGDNKKRGLLGALCDAAKDLTLDYVICEEVTNQIFGLEKKAISRISRNDKVNSLMKKLQDMKSFTNKEDTVAEK